MVPNTHTAPTTRGGRDPAAHPPPGAACSMAEPLGTAPVVEPRWTNGPEMITLVRPGESEGHRADAAARAAQAEQLDLDARDADVELSATGREQADALGQWLADAPEDW